MAPFGCGVVPKNFGHGTALVNDRRMILDHISVNVRDLEVSKAFYRKALAALGIELVMEFGRAAGFGRNNKPDLWIGDEKSSFQTDEQRKVLTPIHVALVAGSRAEVDAFHRAAVAAGGKDFGGPGIRAHYHPN